jgi:hypothetical protein
MMSYSITDGEHRRPHFDAKRRALFYVDGELELG